MSCGASVTLSAVVTPAPRITFFSQFGAWNQTSSVPLIARMSVQLVAVDVACRDRVADAEVRDDLLLAELQRGRGRESGRTRCRRTSRLADHPGPALREAGPRWLAGWEAGLRGSLAGGLRAQIPEWLLM